jgi:hypothetical protein
MPVLAKITMEVTAARPQREDPLSGMIAIEGFLFYGVQREAGSLTVYEAAENAVDVLPDAACASAAGWEDTFIGAETASDPFIAGLFVIQSFFHFRKVLSSFMNCPTSLNCL